MSAITDGMTLAQVGIQVGNEGLVASLMQAAVDGLVGQVPSGLEVGVAAQILGMAAGRCAAVAMHGAPDAAFAEAITSFCEGVAVSSAQCRAKIEKEGI